MDAIAKALDTIKRTIPREILQIAFLDHRPNWRSNSAPISLDEQILVRVIRPRVLVDANIYSSNEVIVPIEGLTQNYIDDFTVMIEIPPEMVNNRQIVSVKSIGYLPYAVSFSAFGAGVGTVGPSGITDLTGAGQRIGDAASNIPPVSEATCDLVGYNTVVIRNFRRITSGYHLRCNVANEDNLRNINPRSYYDFGTLCKLAVKSFIYNEMLVKIDKAYLTGGQDLGSVKQYIDNLVDAEDQYQTFLKEKWSRIAIMNDTLSHQRIIKMQSNPGL